MAFSETTQAGLLRLVDGDALTVQGPFKAESYQANDGSTKVSLSIVADAVLPWRRPKPKKEREEKKAPWRRARAVR